ncbi:hypothetical protein AAG570_000184, partial [Ranatra chinensis]
QCFGVRHVQAFLLFLCFFTTFFLRINLSVAIVAMTDRNSSNPEFEEFHWTEKQKSAVLSSFFWGYLVIQAPAGELGQYLSPKLLLLISNAISATLTALIPLASSYGGWGLLCVIRVFQGIFQGFLVPLSYNLASKWAPPSERNRFVGFSLNGGTLGATAALPLCGLLASSSGGWPSIFYISATLGFVWVILYALFGADSPDTHRYISQEEKEFIHEALDNSPGKKVNKTPWKSILTSIPVWALICAHLGNGWGYAMVLTELPSYINSVLGFDIAANGFLSALPFLSLWIMTFPICWLADFIQKKKILTETTTRKLWTTIAETGSGIMLLTVGFVGRDAIAAMSLVTITVSLSAFIFAGFNINHLDLAPNYAGVLMGITNGLENITTILAPLTVGWIITDNKSVEQWRIAFTVTACVAILGNLVFVLFGTAEEQRWNNENKSEERET